MRIVALLAWYDEDPAWLKRCIESLAFIPVDELIALDGAYGLYPDGQATSPAEQAATIRKAGAAVGITPHIGEPENVWATEIDKRNYLFALGHEITGPDDWYMVIDADEFVTEAPDDLRARLEFSLMDVGSVNLIEPGHARGTIHFPTFPMFFRAIRGLEVAGEHFCYRTPDGRYLWGDGSRQRLEPRAVTGVTVQHHNQFRDQDRRRAAMAYYKARDEAGIEGIRAERFLTKDDCAA